MHLKSVVVASCLLVHHLAFGQLLSLQYFSQRDGLIANDVTTLTQDSRGFLWIGTGEGISVYDGISFTNYRVSDGSTSNSITCIVESRHHPGLMWIGTRHSGLNRFIAASPDGLFRGKIEPVVIDSTRPKSYVTSLAEDGAGALWCATMDGLYRRVQQDVEKIPIQEEKIIQIRVFRAKDDRIWLWINNTIRVYNDKAEVDTTFHLPSTSMIYTGSVFTSPDGTVWLGASDSSLHQFVDSRILSTRKIPWGYPTCLIEDIDGTLWVGSANGLIALREARTGNLDFVRYSVDRGLESNAIVAGLLDREGMLWFANGARGIFKWADRTFTTIPLPKIPEAYNNSRALVDRAGHLWIPSGNSIVEIWRDETGMWKLQQHDPDPGGSLAQPLLVTGDGHGKLWINLESKIRSFRIVHRPGSSSQLVPDKTLIEGRDVPRGFRHCFIIDSRDRLWASISGVGVVAIDPATSSLLAHYSIAEGIPDLSVRVIHEDHQGQIWIGGFLNGIAIVDGTSLSSAPVRRITMEHGLPDNQIRAILDDGQGKVWIGTRYGGLAVRDRDRITQITTRDGLISNSIWCLAKDNRGGVWIGSHAGLQRVDAVSLIPQPTRLELRGAPTVSCGIASQGYLWLVTPEGLMVSSISQGNSYFSDPPVFIRQFEVNGLMKSIGKTVQLDYDQNNCSIEYIGINLRDGQSIRYQYRLLDVDRDWTFPTKQRSVTYAALQPGSYRFQVRALDANGTHSLQPAELAFTIIPPFWNRWWFILCLGVMAVGGITGIVRRRMKLLEEERRRQLEFSQRLVDFQESERKRIAGEIHDSLGQSLLLIRNGILQVQRSITSRDETLDNGFDELTTLALQSINEVREISYDLHPHVLDRLGLRKAIESMVHKISQSSSTKFTTEITGVDSLFPPERAIHLYRILQEAGNNIVKHAQASSASIELKTMVDHLIVRIQDDGIGFKVTDEDSPARSGGGIGLIGIAERVKFLDGVMTIDSKSEQGTTITIEVPFPSPGVRDGL